mmetsp:Transcript_808/g.1078  ORF Transcript_808/g.1078 Transcript_808/m.1078 type:complete len:95 (+) Transcript_808:1266-1550(+)
MMEHVLMSGFRYLGFCIGIGEFMVFSHQKEVGSGTIIQMEWCGKKRWRKHSNRVKTLNKERFGKIYCQHSSFLWYLLTRRRERFYQFYQLSKER